MRDILLHEMVKAENGRITLLWHVILSSRNGQEDGIEKEYGDGCESNYNIHTKRRPCNNINEIGCCRIPDLYISSLCIRRWRGVERKPGSFMSSDTGESFQHILLTHSRVVSIVLVTKKENDHAP